MARKVTNPLEPINVIVCARNGGTPAHRVTLHERVSGGSFGAHESTYWLFEATGCAVKAGRPVKLTNSRKHGAVKMEKLTCVADCGSAVSPAGGDEQRYGGLMGGSAMRRPIASISGTVACSGRTSIRIA